MKLALIQTKQNELYNFPGIRKFEKNEALRLRNEYMDEVLRLTEEAAKKGADLIVTTEAVNFSGHFSKVKAKYSDLYREMEKIENAVQNDRQKDVPAEKSDADIPQDEESRFAAIAANYHVMILAGLVRKENGKLYNSTVFWGRDGKVIDVYHKIHLAGDEPEVFVAGDRLHTVDTEFGRIGMAICWDMQFPEMARNLARKGCDLIVCPTWGWEWIYGPARAYENGIFVAAAMAVPYWMPIEDLRRPSMVVSPDGRILEVGPTDREAIVYCEIGNIHCKESREFRTATPLNI